MKEVDGVYFPLNFIQTDELVDKSIEETIELFVSKCKEILEIRKTQFPIEVYKEFLKVILLRVVDTYWMDHIDSMSELRQAVRLQSYAQKNPLREYQEIGFEKFETLVCNIEDDATKFINRAQIQDNLQREQVAKNTVASSGKEENTKRKPVKKEEKPGPNDPCPCGSGLKYKKCCGRK